MCRHHVIDISVRTLAQAALMLRMTAPRLRKLQPHDSITGEVGPDDVTAPGPERDSNVPEHSVAPPTVICILRRSPRMDD